MNNSTLALPECLSFPSHPDRCDVVVGIRRAMATLSIVGCIFSLLVIWAFQKYQVFSQRIVFWLTVAAMFDGVSYLMSNQHNRSDDLCLAQAFIMMYFHWASLLWVCVISFNLFLNVVLEKATEKLEVSYHLVCWSVPLFMACISYVKKNPYGPAGAWCWIADDHHDLRFGIWYIPVWTAALALTAAYIYIILNLRRHVRKWEGTYNPETERVKELMRTDIQGLKYYPLVYLIISAFATSNRVYNAVYGEENTSYTLLILQAIFNPLQGFLNSIVFALDKETRSRLTAQSLKAAVQGRLNRTHSVQDYPTSSESDTAGIVDHEEDTATSDPVETGVNPAFEVNLQGRLSGEVITIDTDTDYFAKEKKSEHSTHL